MSEEKNFQVKPKMGDFNSADLLLLLKIVERESTFDGELDWNQITEMYNSKQTGGRKTLSQLKQQYWSGGGLSKQELMNNVKETEMKADSIFLDFESKRLDVENKKLDVEDKKLDIELKRLEVELKKIQVQKARSEIHKAYGGCD